MTLHSSMYIVTFGMMKTGIVQFHHLGEKYMEMSERLLQLVVRLQSVESVVQGRQMLLKYARRASGAQRAIVFTLDQERQALVLLDYNGRRLPHPQPDLPSIPMNGLLGAGLLTQGLLYSTDGSTDPRMLPEERFWGWPGGRVLLSAIKTGQQTGDEHGVLVLCFDPAIKRRSHNLTDAPENEGDLLFCSMLLSTYLSRTESHTHTTTTHPRRIKRTTQTAIPLQETVEDSYQEDNLPETMYGLTALSELYAIGLVINIDVDIHTLYLHILMHLSRVARAQGACLLLYHPVQRQFILSASYGDRPPCTVIADSLDSSAMERLATHDSGETLLMLQKGEQRVLLLTLSYQDTLLGVVALAAAESNTLLERRQLLLSYMGNVAALILRNYEMRTLEQQATIEYERKRIALDIHDGTAQHITHALHKLELIERTLEKLSPETLMIEINRTHNMLEVALQDVRQNISSLLPAQIEEQGLAASVYTLLDEYRVNEPGVEITYDIDKPELLPPLLEGVVFRFIQEALNNVRKHAEASRIAIRVRVLSSTLLAEVSDNGRGFAVGAAMQAMESRTSAVASGEHLGLRAMGGRIQKVGGSWEVQSKPGEGTTVKARFPLMYSSGTLTEREREVLRLLVEGLTNRAIAEQLSVSVETIKSHVHHIMQKLQVKDRTQAAVLAARQQGLY